MTAKERLKLYSNEYRRESCFHREIDGTIELLEDALKMIEELEEKLKNQAKG